MTTFQHKIIDGDGHVVEDIASIVKYMPEEYVGRSFSEARGKILFRPSIICIPPTATSRPRAPLPT